MKQLATKYRCNFCGKTHYFDDAEPVVGDMQKFLGRPASNPPEGWIAVDGKHACPDCADEITLADLQD